MELSTRSLEACVTVLVETAPCSQSIRRYLGKQSKEVGLDSSETNGQHPQGIMGTVLAVTHGIAALQK
jgi:hypothetical protein